MTDKKHIKKVVPKKPNPADAKGPGHGGNGGGCVPLGT